MIIYDELNPILADKLWTVWSAIWFTTLLIGVCIVFISKNIHLWKFGKVAIFPFAAALNSLLALNFIWYVAIPTMAFITWLLHFAYKYQQKQIFDWEQNGGYSLLTFRLKKQIKEFPNLPPKEKEKILGRAPKSIEKLNVSFLKLYLIAFLPNVIVSIFVYFLFTI